MVYVTVTPEISTYTGVDTLDDGGKSTIHVLRYLRIKARTKIVCFEEPVVLSDWCHKNGISEAVSGGFCTRTRAMSLGEIWCDGVKQSFEPFDYPWNETRGALLIDSEFNLFIAPRNELQLQPSNDLLQAGPLLVYKGEICVKADCDSEGFARAASQFDSDITMGRYPRSAIGINDKYIFAVAVDGRSADNAGYTVSELAQFMKKLGADHALNLDGGGSSTLICEGVIINKPRDTFEGPVTGGRKLHSAIIFC